jgi:hypothetical protein
LFLYINQPCLEYTTLLFFLLIIRLAELPAGGQAGKVWFNPPIGGGGAALGFIPIDFFIKRIEIM